MSCAHRGIRATPAGTNHAGRQRNPWRRVTTTAACCACLAIAALLAGCSRTPDNRLQGYIEGEFVYVSSPLAGTVEKLSVSRGAHVDAGQPLFQLESRAEHDARAEAAGRLAQALATLEDARKGRRPPEIESIRAQVAQAREALSLAEKDLARQQQLMRDGGVTTQQELDRARTVRDQDTQRVAQLQAELETAQLGSRTDLVAAAEADVAAMQAALSRAQWSVDQKHQAAPTAAAVFDTLYREGEWVAAGRPVVALLPPENVKVRVFMPEPQVGSLHLGDSMRVFVDGTGGPVNARVTFISPRAEYTPPVIYSRENRSKLVFMVEGVFDAAAAARLHPGQPVDVAFGSQPSR